MIGDQHHPFCREDYLGFLIDVYGQYNCNRVVNIGDIIDNHYASYHESDPDGMGGGDELELAIERNALFVKQWPEMDALIGNHDAIPYRKGKTGKIPSRWIRSLPDVLNAPGWRFHESLIIDGVYYNHGLGKKAHMKAKSMMCSTVQGHYHSEAYTIYQVGMTQSVFGTQVGCGIDHKSYAMSYAKDNPPPAIGCAVIIGGHTAINILMKP